MTELNIKQKLRDIINEEFSDTIYDAIFHFIDTKHLNSENLETEIKKQISENYTIQEIIDDINNINSNLINSLISGSFNSVYELKECNIIEDKKLYNQSAIIQNTENFFNYKVDFFFNHLTKKVDSYTINIILNYSKK